jgi:hypothetical protein
VVLANNIRAVCASDRVAPTPMPSKKIRDIDSIWGSAVPGIATG